MIGKGKNPVPIPPSVNSSKKEISVAPEVILVLDIVYLTTTLSPGFRTGSGANVPTCKNSIIRVGIGSTNKSSVAIFPTTGEPSTVPVTVLVVFVYIPGVVAAGTNSSTLTVQLPSGAMVPPLKPIVVLPTPETEPPQSLDSNELKVNPANTLVRSSVKAISVIVFDE